MRDGSFGHIYSKPPRVELVIFDFSMIDLICYLGIKIDIIFRFY